MDLINMKCFHMFFLVIVWQKYWICTKKYNHLYNKKGKKTIKWTWISGIHILNVCPFIDGQYDLLHSVGASHFSTTELIRGHASPLTAVSEVWREDVRSPSGWSWRNLHSSRCWGWRCLRWSNARWCYHPCSPGYCCKIKTLDKSVVRDQSDGVVFLSFCIHAHPFLLFLYTLAILSVGTPYFSDICGQMKSGL